MAEQNIIVTLTRKREAIEAAIVNYERLLEQSRRDLAAVEACLAVFAAEGEPADVMPYFNLHRLFKRGETNRICMEALAAEGPLSTRELALRVIRAKGMDEGDKALRKAIAYRIVQALTLQRKRGRVALSGKVKGVCVWRREPHLGQG
jgi:hypothetical protein